METQRLLKAETWNWHISVRVSLAKASHTAKPKGKGWEVHATPEEVMERVWSQLIDLGCEP